MNTKSKELNCIGFPHDDPYGLAEAWWKIFTKPEVKKEKELLNMGMKESLRQKEERTK